MSKEVRITSLRDGDIVTGSDGVESEGGLRLRIEGTAPVGVPVTVNDVHTKAGPEGFSCEVTLTDKVTRIVAKTAGASDEVRVLWLKGGARKRFRFSVDDNIEFLKDLARTPEGYPSLFDHWYLGFWRELHRGFGVKVHLNIYYQTDDFDLTDMPDCWREEWEANAHWLHLSFHALQDKPDRPYRHARYPQMAHDFDLVTGHIRRFAGNAVLSTTTTVHWAECPRDAALALRDRGIETLVALFDRQGYDGECTTGYYLDRELCAHCDGRGAWHDFDTGLTFIRCTAVVNALKVDEVESFLEARTATPQTAEMLELLIHEQYFRKELTFYQPDVMEKVRRSVAWAVARGYEPVFWSEGVLGITP